MGRTKAQSFFKKRKAEEGICDDRVNFEEPHEGSIPLEEIKSHEDYSRRLDHSDAPKRKYAVALGYCGSNYSGLQINPNVITIEAVLEKALFLAGGIQECNFGNLQKLSWSRAARTDRGVHAAAQCCSMKLTIPPGYERTFIADVNSFLPEDIRVITVTRTTKNFNAKITCSHRRYQYLLPTYVLQTVSYINNMMQTRYDIQGRYNTTIYI
jgi:tRNA pseudouridine38-40 synthase